MTITVKFVAKGHTGADAPLWSRQLPDGQSWGDLRFVFDPEARAYDWLVVYDDLPPLTGERFSMRAEELACPPDHTIFITAEPTSIKTYGQDFLKQFGHVVSSLEPWATPRLTTTNTQPGLRWFFGTPYSWKKDPSRIRTYAQLQAASPHKTKDFSTVCSNKRMKHTLHNQRVDFTDFIKAKLPQFEIFGHGVREVDDKAEAIDEYRYHLAIENHICPHHFTDKLTDPLLGFALPFYIGAPNAADYFPPESFIALDINQPEEAVKIISAAIANNEYEKRLPAIIEARRRVMEQYNIFPLIAQTIAAAKPSKDMCCGAAPCDRGDVRRCPHNQKKPVLLARRAMLKSSPLVALRFGVERGIGWLRARI